MYSEAYFYDLWEGLPLGKNILNTNSELSILSKGKLSSNIGPDFQGARISLNGIVLHGDIEIHIRSSDWYYHGHHVNQAYNNVILHLVSTGDNREIKTSSGISIPEISFGEISSFKLKPDKQPYDLDKLFYQRFARKITYCEDLLQFHTPEDAIWILWARTLGYNRNPDTMELFARVYHPSRIRHLFKNYDQIWEHLLYLAFRKETYISNEKYRNFPAMIIPWRAGGRPANDPRRRIKYLGFLIRKFWDDNLFDAIKQIVTERKDHKFIISGISEILRIEEEDLNPGKMILERFIINWILPILYCFHYYLPPFQLYLLDMFYQIPAEKTGIKIIDKYGKPANALESQALYELNERMNGDFKPWIKEVRIPYGI